MDTKAKDNIVATVSYFTLKKFEKGFLWHLGNLVVGSLHKTEENARVWLKKKYGVE